MNEAIVAHGGKKTATGHPTLKVINTVNSEQQRRNASRGEVFGNSLIQGRKVDSPKIFLGNQIGDDRPKTSTQQTRKVKSNKDTKDGKKKIGHHRKNATALNASQVVSTSAQFTGKTLLNLGLQTNKDVDARKFDFGLPPHTSKLSSQ